MDAVKINNVSMPVHTEISYETNDLYGENTGRDEAGYMHLDLIRSNVRKWKIQYEMLTGAELNKLVSALNPLGFNFTCEHTAGIVTTKCYGTVSGTKFRCFGLNEQPLYDCEVNIIEL